MKPAVVLAWLLLAAAAAADCDAPALSLPKREGPLHGIRVTRLVGESRVDEALARGHTVIPFGDDHLGLAGLSGGPFLRELQPDGSAVAAALLRHLAPGPFDGEQGTRTYSVQDVRTFDLTGDLAADLILFTVSPGANLYPGAVGIDGDRWVTLVEPTCY